MSRFSIPAFLTSAAQIAGAQLEGHTAGLQANAVEEQAGFQQALSAVQAMQAERDRQNQALMRLPLEEGSQAQLAQHIVNQPSPFSGLQNLPYVRHTPGLQNIFGAPPTAPPVAPPSAGPMPSSAQASPAAPGLATGLAPPAGPPPPAGMTAPSPAAGRTFQVPGGPSLTLRGVDPKEAAAALTDLKKTSDELANVDFGDDAKSASAVRDLIAQVPPQIRTPEELAQARQVLTSMKQAMVSLGPRAATNRRLALKDEGASFQQEVYKNFGQLDDLSLAGALSGSLAQERDIKKRMGGAFGGAGLEASASDIDEIQKRLDAGDKEGASDLAREVRGRIISKKTPQQEKAAVSNAMAFIGKLDPVTVTDDIVQSVFDRFGVGYIVKGGPPGSMGLGGAAVRKQLQESLNGLSRWKDLNPAAQKVALDHIRYLAKASGDPVEVPNEIVSQMTDKQRKELAFAGVRLHQAKARIDLDRARFDWMKQHGPNSVDKDSRLTKNQQALYHYRMWDQATKDYNAIFAKGSALSGERGTFDPTAKYPAGSDEAKAAELYRTMQDNAQAYHDFIMGSAGPKVPANSAAPGRVQGAAPAGRKADYSTMSDQELKAALARKLMGR